jgi:hypothetical protein
MRGDHEVRQEDGDIWAAMYLDREQVKALAMACGFRADELIDLEEQNADMSEFIHEQMLNYRHLEDDLNRMLRQLELAWKRAMPPA